MGKLGKIALVLGVGLVVLPAISTVAWWIRLSPTHDDTKLVAMNAEAHALMALGPTEDWRGVPKNRWPVTIASFNPLSVHVYNWGVEVEIKEFVDGGWGYDIVRNGAIPPMPMACLQNLGRGIYWHGPC